MDNLNMEARDEVNISTCGNGSQSVEREVEAIQQGGGEMEELKTQINGLKLETENRFQSMEQELGEIKQLLKTLLDRGENQPPIPEFEQLTYNQFRGNLDPSHSIPETDDVDFGQSITEATLIPLYTDSDQCSTTLDLMRQTLPRILEIIAGDRNAELGPQIINVMQKHLALGVADEIFSNLNVLERISSLFDIARRHLVGEDMRLYVQICKTFAGLDSRLYHLLSTKPANVEDEDECVREYRDKMIISVTQTGQSVSGSEPRTYAPLKMKMSSWQDKFPRAGIERDRAHNVSNSENNNDIEPNVLQIPVNTNGPIILRGRAGIGKTTTMEHKVVQWANEEWAKPFTLVFLLKMKMLSTDEKLTVGELLTKMSAHKLEYHIISAFPSLWLQNHSVRVLIELDGLDEIPNFSSKMRNAPCITCVHEKGSAFQLVINILRGNLLPKSTLVCTSRPFLGLDAVGRCTLVDIVGLTKDGVICYVRGTFPDKANEILAILDRNNILMSFCSITFYCTEITRGLSRDPLLSDTRIGTYTRLTSYILKRHNSRQYDGDSTFATNATGCFAKLAELAYNGIFANRDTESTSKLVFTDDDLGNVGMTSDERKHAEKSGLLQFSRNPDEDSIICEFIHLSIQELLAMTHFLIHCQDINCEKLAEMLDSKESFNMLSLFLFGLKFDKNGRDIKSLKIAVGGDKEDKIDEKTLLGVMKLFRKDHMKSSDQYLKLRICQMAMESQSSDVAEIAMEAAVDDSGELAFTGVPMTAVDCQAIQFSLQKSKRLTSISILNANLDDIAIRVITEFVKGHGLVEKLDLTGNSFTGESKNAIGDMLKSCTRLADLYLGKNKINDDWMEGSFKDGLQANSSLTSLILANNSISDDGAKILATCLEEKSEWRKLILRYNQIGKTGAYDLIHQYDRLALRVASPGKLRLDLSLNMVEEGEVESSEEYSLHI